MAILREESFKLNIYESGIENAIFACEKGEKQCKSMINKLIFYNRNDVLQAHSNNLSRLKNTKQNKLMKQISPLENNEWFDSVISLSKNWLAVTIKNIRTNDIQPKFLYISPDGEGYLSDNPDGISIKIVPEEVLLRYIKDNPIGFTNFDKIYYDGSHDDFLKQVNDLRREIFTDTFSKLLDKPEFCLEEILNYIQNTIKTTKDKDERDLYLTLDLMAYSFLPERIIEFDNKYNRKQIEPSQ